MTKYVIHGGKPLFGEIDISGAKNAAVAIIPAALLVDGVCRIENIPQISDVTLILNILQELGADVRTVNRTTVDVDCSHIRNARVPEELARKICEPPRVSAHFLKPVKICDPQTEIREAVDIPLVLHGSSGVPDEDVQRAVSMGVCKVNFATELRAAYTQALRDCLAHDAALYDPKKYGGPAREAVISLVRHRIKICAGKVGLIAPL